jgi:hypothetical protein
MTNLPENLKKQNENRSVTKQALNAHGHQAGNRRTAKDLKIS